MNRLKDELPLSEPLFLILCSLISPCHGYGIMQNVEIITKGKVSIGPGTMYGTVKKLLKKQIIREIQGIADQSKRKNYSLTDRGKRLLNLEIKRLIMLGDIGKQVRSELSAAEGRE